MGKGEATKEAILDEAIMMATTVGLGGMTIGALATKAQLSKSGLYAHFQSKEDLQLQVLEHARIRFVAEVIAPALAAPRGEPRVRALFEAKLRWSSAPGGCIFIAASSELDDRPGLVRDRLARNQRDWLDTIAEVFRTGIAEGQFHADADPEQFAFDFDGVMLSFHHTKRLLDDQTAERRARRSLDALLAAARAG
ncbi:MAG TPA: TetR/AcrR family transcriptional regulator [Actinophytocola sp.]|uniref:TetR/AcrR family transcriptional regulator n=1 Tax=Actinophytocola sp. TaxID=1872138 RepID=UPI002DDD59E9|nr:TetR/AcrR family transcriptional regulator [Actinophytocola sp.]HEV2781124.1 TetR/AcrR family transcriptional regulator [Actinophytocola sp.]